MKDKLLYINSDKEILLKEIHHRVKNNLQLVISLLNIQAQDTQNFSVEEFIEAGRLRISAMALIHQNLYQTENYSHVVFQTYLNNLIENIKGIYFDKDIDFEINTNKIDFNMETAIPLGLIINELICNSMKYAFLDNVKGKITIEIQKRGGGVFELIIGDNGVGFSENEVESFSVGLELIGLLIKQLEGKCRKIELKGTYYCIEFKEVFVD